MKKIHVLHLAYEYNVVFDENSQKTCKMGDAKKEKFEPTSFSKCKRKCDDDANCRFMRYSIIDNWCYTFAKCDEYQEASAGITYYKESESYINSIDCFKSHIYFSIFFKSYHRLAIKCVDKCQSHL